jgi:hypothetical protein
MAPKNRDRNSLPVFEHGREQVGGFDGLASGATGVVQRELEDELSRLRHPEVVGGSGGNPLQVLFNRLENRVRIHIDVAHDLGEEVPLHLSKRQEQMFDGQRGLLASPSFVHSAVDDSLRRVADLAG